MRHRVPVFRMNGYEATIFEMHANWIRQVTESRIGIRSHSLDVKMEPQMHTNERNSEKGTADERRSDPEWNHK